MKFKSAAAVEEVTWTMLLADFPRADNRALINGLANGEPPYTDDEAEQNHIATNVNFLELTKITHDARRQFSNAFLTPDPLFTVNVDYGPLYKRREWGSRITREWNKVIKRSLLYHETRRSVFANTVLHGIGPCMWEDRESWAPNALGVEDVLVPSNTLLTMKNLPFLALYNQYTGAQMMKMTTGPHVDPGWNLPLVEQSIQWVEEQARTLNSTNWPEVWFPEKMAERRKSDAGLYASDAVPTIDVFDFYYWDDDGKSSGWRRRMILDAWGQPGVGGVPDAPMPGSRRFQHGKGKFLFNPGNRKYADNLSEIIHFQFADASAVAPFRYHTVRSLGFLLYAVCHLQNRLRCKFNDSVFEALLQYFRVANPADMDRLQKIDLVDKGLLPEGLNFVKPEERWAVNQQLVSEAFQMNRQTMADNSASFTQDFDFERERGEETATRTMAKVNATAALVGAMLNQAYNYQTFQYLEIARRFCIENSKDPGVRKARVECLKHGVPEEALSIDRLDIQPTRVIGQGNKMLEVAIADKLMAVRPLLDPEAQRDIDRIYIAANSNDYDLSARLVPDEPKITDSIHDAELAFGTLMQGVPVTPKGGLNAQEIVETILRLMAVKIQTIGQTGGVGTPADVIGLGLAAQYCQAFIDMLAEDKSQKERVAAFGKGLGKLMNEVKAFAQRQQQAMQKAGQGNGGMDPKDMAKVQAMMIQAKTKAKLAAESHAQRTAQRQLQWEMEQKRKDAEHQQGVAHDMVEHRANLAKTGIETEHNVRMNRLKSMTEPEE